MRLHATGPQMGAHAGLNSAALVNESYLQRAGRVRPLDFPSLGHFFAYPAQVVGSVIVRDLRTHSAERQGGAAAHVTLDTTVSSQLAADMDESGVGNSTTPFQSPSRS